MGSIERMVAHAVAIADDDSHGYSQVDRWGTDRDCSSLMYESADVGGYGVGRGPGKTRYTGTMLADFTAAGFEALPFDGLGSLRRGDILLNVAHHTELCIGGGEFVGAHGSETGGAHGRPGDQTGGEVSVVPAYVYWAGWDCVLRPPADGSTDESEEEDMQCIFQPNGERYLVYYDGAKCHPLGHPDEVTAINMVYRQTHGGRDIPTFALGDEGAPWAARFMEAVAR